MEGLTTIQSNFGPRETMERLEAEIKTRGMTVFARFDHAALAGEAGLTLRPTEVIVFGNPRGGTLLMQANQTIGIDLPLKALVWQDESGNTWLSYNEPPWLAQRHNVTGVERPLTAMTQMLSDVAAKAAKDISPGGLGVQPSAAAPLAKSAATIINPPMPAQTVVPELARTSLILRFAAIAVVVVGIAALFAYAGGWLTPHALTAARIVDRFEEGSGGPHLGFRRNHAKGVCVSGYFEGNGQGKELSKAIVFEKGRVPIIGRFSLPGGQPYAADASSPVRGLGIRFKLSDGEEWRTAMVNLPVFPVSTPQAFYEFMLATAPDPATGKPKPAAMQDFFARHPDSAKAIQLIGGAPKPAGFENSIFNSLNAFRFVSASDAVTWVRLSLVPVEKIETASAANTTQDTTNQLFDAVIASVHQHPLQWHLVVTVAESVDATADATIPWPSSRRQVDVGTLTINEIESDDTSPARDINFDPLVLPNGIAASDDPLLSTRSAVYSKSFTRREGEAKSPSAISPAETKK